jgi:hypothetical protein
VRKLTALLALAFLLLTLVSSPRASAQQSHVDDVLPKVIVAGLDAYKADGPESAVKAWIAASPIEGSKEALSQANVLRQVQDFYGPYKSFDLVESRNLTPSTRIVYLVLNYAKGPLFARFTIYRTDEGWILTNFTFNTKEEEIFPPGK